MKILREGDQGTALASDGRGWVRFSPPAGTRAGPRDVEITDGDDPPDSGDGGSDDRHEDDHPAA